MRRVRSMVMGGALMTLLATTAPSAVATEEEPARSRPEALEGSSLTWCGDVEPPEADPSLFRDEPVYLGNPPTGQLRQWARRQPGYADLWIDRDNLGWIVVAFAQDTEQRQTDIERRFPELGAVAVAVEHSLKELRQVRRRIEREVAPGLEDWVLWESNINRIGLEVGELDDEAVAFLEEAIGDDPVCVDGRDPSELTPDGPQPLAGDGWVLLGHRQGRERPLGGVGLASDQAQHEALWARTRMPGEAPPVDFERDVVLWFSQTHGSSCANLRLDDVVIDLEARVVSPLVVMPDDPMFCTADLAGAHHYLVAVERDRLPAAPFAIQLDPERASSDSLMVEADLQAPGSLAAADQISRQDPPEVLARKRSGGSVEVGYASDYVMDVSCGVGYLGQLNGVHFVSDDTVLPEAWAAEVSEDGELVVSVLLKGGQDPHATANAAGHAIRYEPRRDAPASGCEG